MADSFFDKFIADLVKGASSNTRANGGPGVNIVVDRENRGHEVKLANHGGLGGAGGALLGSLGGVGSPSINAALGAAAGADEGQRVPAALGAGAGSFAGGALGAGTGAALSNLLHVNPELAALLGQAGGNAIGGAVGGHLGGKQAALVTFGLANRATSVEHRYVDGVKAAAAAFGIKEAFLPALLPLAGSLLGGTALRAGAGALARGAGGKALGGMAGKILPKMTGGIGGAATDMVGSMAGGAMGQKLAPQPQQQQQQPMMN